MPNLMQFLRMANIFGPQPPIGNDLPSQGGITGMMSDDGSMAPAPNPPNQMPFFRPTQATAPQPMTGGDPNGFDPEAIMAQMYKPQTDAEDRFNALENKFPNRENYKPSALRRIGGALMAFSSGMAPGRGLNFYHANPAGIQAGQNFLDEPYDEAMADWKAQIQPAEYAANLERQGNVNERMLANQTVNQIRQDKKMEQDAAIAQAKQDNANARTEVYRFKANHPGVKFNYTGPTVTYADPITGKVTDTGVKTGRLTDQDKADLNQEYAMERIDETGQNAMDLEGKRQTGRESLQQMKGWSVVNITDPNDPTKQIAVRINNDTGDVSRVKLEGKDVGPAAKPGSGGAFGAGGRPELPSQTRIRMFNAAMHLYNTRPDLRPFITPGAPGANDFKVTPPHDSSIFGHSGPTNAQLAEINMAIYGNPEGASAAPMAAHGATPAPAITPTRTGRTAPMTPKVPAPAGRIYIYDKSTGQPVGTVPAGQRTQAMAQGYVVD